MPVNRCVAGAVLCQNDIQCLLKVYGVIDSDIDSTNISNKDTFNTYYFISLHAELPQTILREFRLRIN